MDISIDSRTIQPGQYFIPVNSGRKYIQDAIDKGGRLLDVNLSNYARQYRKKLNCHVIGLTGSSGKTTCKDLLSSVLGQRFRIQKTQGNQNNEIGVPLSILRADHETEILIVEMGMRKKGDIRLLTQWLQPTHAVITNIGTAHLEFFQSQRHIAYAKAEIFRKQAYWQKGARFAFLNTSSPYFELLADKARHYDYDILPFMGEDKPDQNVQLCYQVGRHFGLSESQIKDGIDAYQPSENRLDVQRIGDVTLINDAYNANPDGVEYALTYLKQYQGRKIMVLGDMKELGKNTVKIHQSLASLMIEAGVDILMTLGPVSAQINSESMDVLHYQDQAQLNATLKAELKEGDIVLVKGSRALKLEETVAYLAS